MKNKVYYGEYSLKHWIDLILSKNIVLPNYQRSFVWKEEQVKRLIQAFKDDLFVPPVTIGAFVKDNQSMNLVLDGQQRLTSILLAYLNVYPNKNIFKEPKNNEKIYSSDDSFDGDNLDNEPDTVIKWTFDIIQNHGSTPKEIREYISNNKEKYPSLDIEIALNDDFLEKHYLGFSFLIPNSPTMQKNYYASVFREINTGGANLLPQESREALYYLNEELKEFFDPKFTSRYKIKINNTISKMDFVRYISIISEYQKDGKSANIAIGTKGKLEDYYIEYISAVIQNQNSNKFGKFDDIFPDKSWKDKIKLAQSYLSRIVKSDNFDSIINMDITMFGLIYFVIFKGEKLQDSQLATLFEKIKIKSDEYRKNDRHTKSPNSLKYLRERIDGSVEIYKEFINESA